MSDERPTEQEEKAIERSASRAIAVIIVVAVVVILLFWLLGYDALRDALS